MAAHMLACGVCNNFSAGALDFLLYGVILGEERTRWIYVVLIGIVAFAVYYFLFKFLILKFNLRLLDSEDTEEAVRLHSKKEYLNKGKLEKSAVILEGLGGLTNIIDIDACATRLRVRLQDGSRVQQDLLKQSGSVGIVLKGNSIQVVYGPQVSNIRTDLEDYIMQIEEEKKEGELVNEA